MKCVFAFYILLFGVVSFAETSGTQDLTVTSVSTVEPWQAGRNQEIKIDIGLPHGFHAYADQFKVLNISPSDFSIGSLSLAPETEFFDKYTNKNRKGIFESGFIKLVVEAPTSLAGPNQKVSFDLRYQICSETICYLLQTKIIEVLTNENLSATGSAITAPVQSTFSLFQSLDKLLQSSLLLAFISVFLAGILTSFTPCIFPMLPITVSVLGYNAEKNSRMQNLLRALSYVFGIAITYSSLGVIAALTGSLFGSMLTNKYVLSGLVLLFFAMAFSMWGFYEMQSPAFIRNKLGSGKSHGLVGAFMMGLAAGIVASPCVGPVLVSILTFVSTTKNVLLGFSLLFTFALGLGLLFIVIGLFSSTLNLLPKSGPWMDAIKFVLGAAMWGAALYYAQFLISPRLWMLLVATSFMALAIWKGAFNFKNKNYLKRSILLAIFIFSSAVLVVTLFKPSYILKSKTQDASDNSKNIQSSWMTYSNEALLTAKQDKKPVMIDFFAEWCGACHELDEKTFSTLEFKELSKSFTLLKFDATNDSSEVKEVLKKYDIKGLPTVMFFNAQGEIIKNLTFTQFLTIDELKPKMQEALK